MKILRFILILSALILPFSLSAGWVITGVVTEQDGTTIAKRYFIEKNIVKVEQYNLIYTCNLITGSIILVDPENLVYARTTLNEYIEKIRSEKMKALARVVSVIPENERAKSEAQFKKEMEESVKLPVNNGNTMEIMSFPGHDKIAGYEIAKFQVIEADGLKENFSVTFAVNLKDDLDMEKFLLYQHLLEPNDKTFSYITADKYRKLADKGIVMQREIFNSGLVTRSWKVEKVEKKTVPAYELGTPALCKEITLSKWLVRNKKADDLKYDDYE